MERTNDADMVLTNGTIFTSRDDLPMVEALAIKRGKILEAGSTEEIQKFISTQTKVLDLQGRFTCPGFNDAHIHFMSGGLYAKRLILQGTRSPEEVAERVQEKTAALHKGDWILGRGWDHTVFSRKKWPSKEILDRAAPEGGAMIKDSRTGEPTGILKESAADLVYDLIPGPTKKKAREAIEYALQEAKRFGITSIQDNSKVIALDVYEELVREGKLTVRVSEWLELKEDLSEYKSLKEKYSDPDGLIRFFTLKGYVDGSLGSRTAAMMEPYSDQPSASGLLQMSQENLNKLVKNAHSNDFTVALHAIGDLAVRIALNALEEDADNRKKKRDRVEHVQIIHSEDLTRFESSGITASMQPIHCSSDMRWAGKRVGEERSLGAYAWKSLINIGAPLAFGTDWPVEQMNPMLGLYAAVTRKDFNGEPESGWIPKEKLTVEEAIKCYTKWPAYAEFQEDRKGTIERGKYADIVVLSRNLLEIDPADIPSVEVVMTIFNGEVIYEKEDSLK
jgi:predicted amidohydrolase YtcJ